MWRTTLWPWHGTQSNGPTANKKCIVQLLPLLMLCASMVDAIDRSERSRFFIDQYKVITNRPLPTNESVIILICLVFYWLIVEFRCEHTIIPNCSLKLLFFSDSDGNSFLFSFWKFVVNLFIFSNFFSKHCHPFSHLHILSKKFSRSELSTQKRRKNSITCFNTIKI